MVDIGLDAQGCSCSATQHASMHRFLAFDFSASLGGLAHTLKRPNDEHDISVGVGRLNRTWKFV